MVNNGCNSECIFGKKCLSYVDISEMSRLKEDFWGKPHQRAFLPKKRKEMIANIFTICQANKVIKYYYNPLFNLNLFYVPHLSLHLE